MGAVFTPPTTARLAARSPGWWEARVGGIGISRPIADGRGESSGNPLLADAVMTTVVVVGAAALGDAMHDEEQEHG